jgi:TolA-binding protein
VVEELGILKNQIEKQAPKVEARAAAPAPSADSGQAQGAASAQTVFDQAEKLFKEKKWQQAILKYQEYRDRHPKGRNFAEATYKIGVCFQEIGMMKEARTFYEEVITRFPNTPQATRSHTRMRALRI